MALLYAKLDGIDSEIMLMAKIYHRKILIETVKTSNVGTTKKFLKFRGDVAAEKLEFIADSCRIIYSEVPLEEMKSLLLRSSHLVR
jgi:hypothetical protein